MVLVHERQYEPAIEHLKRSVKIAPKMGVSHLYLGRALLRMNRAHEAVSHLNEAARLNPEDAAVYYQLWQAYGKLGQQELAAAAQDKFEKLSQLRLDREQARAARAREITIPDALADEEIVLRRR
jgi:predicted Zn-dependent protease